MKKRFAFNGFIALTILAGILLLVSCSTAPSPGSSSTPASQSKPAGTPTPTKPSGELKVGISHIFFNIVDPRDSGIGSYADVTAGVFDQLFDLTPEGQTVPALAERWEMAPDGMSQTFYIRKGVKFHDGSDLTGADVKFSLERLLAPVSKNPDAATVRGQIASVDLKDDYTVVVRLKQPLFELLPSFGTPTGAGGVVPKKYIEQNGEDNFQKVLPGSGPWKLVRQTTGSRIELEAIESNWRAVPKFKNLTVLSVPEEATKVAMLKTGELDFAQVNPDSVAALKAAGLRIVNHDAGDTYYVILYYDVDNPSKYAMGDVRVRKALSFGVNRQEMADKLYGGAAQPGVIFYVPKTAYFYDPNVLKADPYDPDQAKKLLADAGHPNGFSTKIWDQGGLTSMLNQAVAGYWRKIGVNVDLIPIDFPTLRTKISPKHSPDIWDTATSHFGQGGAWQFERVAPFYHSTKGFAKNHKNPKLDELIDKVPMTADPAEKKKLALQAAVLIKEEYDTPTFLNPLAPFAISSKVGDIKLTKGMAYLGYSFETATHPK